MAKKRKILFKDLGASLNIGSQRFHQGNITPEIYDELVKINPAYADHFQAPIEVEEDKSVTAEQEAKPAKPVKP